MRQFVLIAHSMYNEGSGKLTVPGNCVVSYFNTHNNPISFDQAQKCILAILKRNGLLSEEVPSSLYLPGVEMINYTMTSGNTPLWMEGRNLGLYEIQENNGNKQLYDVQTGANFRLKLEDVITFTSNYINSADFILIVVACRTYDIAASGN